MPHILRFAFVALIALGLAAHQAARADAPAALPAPAATDSAKIQTQLNEGFAALKKAGKLVPLASLRAQLARKSCALALPKAQPPVPVALPALYRAARESVMMVGGSFDGGSDAPVFVNAASGYMITDSGVMATNYHVVAKAQEEKGDTPEDPAGMIAMDRHGAAYPVIEVLAADEKTDVALVRLGGAGFHPLVLRADAEVGESIAVIGHPDSYFYMLSTGIISQYQVNNDPGLADALAADRPVCMCVTADFGGGSSGSPVLDAGGQAVGMVAATSIVVSDEQDALPPDGEQPEKKKEPKPAATPITHPMTQMVMHFCVPAADVLKLIKTPAESAAK